MAECVVYTGKISQLIRVSREQCYQEGTAEQLSQSVARALVKKADQAFINQAAPTPRANGPRGVLLKLNVMGVVNGGAVASDLDTLVDVVAELQSNGGTPTHIVGPARLG